MSFDLRVHIRDPKTAKIVKVQPYKLHIKDGEKIFERDGAFFYEDNTEVPFSARQKLGMLKPQEVPVQAEAPKKEYSTVVTNHGRAPTNQKETRA